MGNDDCPGVSQFNIWCNGWDYCNQKWANLALQGTLADVDSHTINAKY